MGVPSNTDFAQMIYLYIYGRPSFLFPFCIASFNEDPQVLGTLFYDFPCNFFCFFHIAGQKSAVTNNIDQSGTAPGE